MNLARGSQSSDADADSAVDAHVTMTGTTTGGRIAAVAA
jgi:hypothetical protein